MLLTTLNDMAIKEKVKELSRELKIELSKLHQQRVNLIASAVISMSTIRSVNMVKVAHGMISKAKPLSNYRRLQRFISQVDWDDTGLGHLLLKMSELKGPYTLLVDRTNWQFGKVDINFLVFSILGDGYSIPIKWVLLPKKGNSAQYERIELLEEVVKIVGKGQIKNVIGDREFIGQHWVKYLITNEIGFNLRVKEGMVGVKNGTEVKLGLLCKNNKRSSPRLPGKYLVGGNEVYVSGFRFRNDKNKLEYLIVIHSEDVEDACDIYAKRWYIENMFKDMKTNGFQLEDTHVTHPKRLETLFGLLAISYVWMIRIGEWIKRKIPSLFKKNNRGKRRKSIFRGGIDNYINAYINHDRRKIWLYFRFLSCT